MISAVAVALVATACGGEADPRTAGQTKAGDDAVTTTAGGTGASSSPPDVATAGVPESLRFTAAGVDGAQVVGADFAGEDVALWFWAPW